jgi:hypothetical protein
VSPAGSCGAGSAGAIGSPATDGSEGSGVTPGSARGPAAMAGAQAQRSRLAVAAVRRAARFTHGVVGAPARRLNEVD